MLRNAQKCTDIMHATCFVTACWIRCVFDTMLGGGGAGGVSRQRPMTAEEIAAPFVQAFAAEGGCSSVLQ